MNSNLQTIEPERLPQAITPSGLLQLAVQQGADLDRLERLMNLQERWEANEARKAYVAAMAAFKQNPPKIFKDRHVRFESQKGVTEYDHATLGNVVETVVGALAQHGISHRWSLQQIDGGMIRVTCILTHALGHSEETSLQGSPDQSGGKNNIQAVGSTVSYLERYTLLAACGVATYDIGDDDGRGDAKTQGGPDSRQTLIPQERYAELESLLRNCGTLDDLHDLWRSFAGIERKAMTPVKDEVKAALVSLQ